MKPWLLQGGARECIDRRIQGIDLVLTDPEEFLRYDNLLARWFLWLIRRNAALHSIDQTQDAVQDRDRIFIQARANSGLRRQKPDALSLVPLDYRLV